KIPPTLASPFHRHAIKSALWSHLLDFVTLRDLLACGLSVPETGEINSIFGVFKSDFCGAEIVIASGAIFPGCPNHRDFGISWKPIEAGPDTPAVQPDKKPIESSEADIRASRQG